MPQLDSATIAGVIAEVMGSIRKDVEIGSGPDIEADAVLLNVAQGLVQKFYEADPEFDGRAFNTACDLDILIPGSAFHH